MNCGVPSDWDNTIHMLRPIIDAPESVRELIVFMHYVEILIALPCPCDVLLCHFRKMLLYVRG